MTSVTKTGDLPLSVRDYGGGGQDVLLLHGGGRTAEDWDPFASVLLENGLRPVAMDLRSHGDSGSAPWSWSAAADDVSAVVEALGLSKPIVIGHSLGGMVAAVWATEHPECRLAVNLDGHGNPTRPDQLLGMDEVSADWAFGHLAEELEDMAKGLDDELREIMRAIDALDLFATYRAARCPLLVVTGDLGSEYAMLFREPAGQAWSAGFAGLKEQLARLDAESSLVTTASMATGHDPHREDPEGLVLLIAEQVEGFAGLR
ncbi:pimeloyl-ACP methyl ester carboxylesterase [Streptomyces africanus]|uniref:Pimeloyl-ACP methyl ester carboxylesterase n=1 Tax=Streptomyces africanus TaxID=231024 RepID=A0ABU0QS87_9ACTN|nr:alpha/beta hydrolase [Streptomyces africanus]MDQ0750261.1 pimeloyl-ACP methyl ester carboxylesterase [Streptomyces africanus]